MTERELFEAWVAERWGPHAWRHTSNCCGEWDAWVAGMEQERRAAVELREIAILAHRALEDAYRVISTIDGDDTHEQWELDLLAKRVQEASIAIFSVTRQETPNVGVER